MANEAKPVTRRHANEFSVAEGASLEGIYTQEELETENKFALSGEQGDLDQEHEAASEEKKWAVDRYGHDGSKETSLYTDRELDQEMDRIAEERAAGDQVDLRLATPDGQEQDREQAQGDQNREAEHREAEEREAEQREQDQRDQAQREADQREQRQRAEQEQREMDEHLRQVAELQQREQAEEQARQQQNRPPEGTQQKDSLEEQVIQDAHEGRTDPEAIERLDQYEERTQREMQERRDQEMASLRQEMLEGKEHYYGYEQSMEPGNGDSTEHWRYNPELQAAAERHFSQDQERIGGRADGREESREQSAPSQPAVEMEMER
jgi:hypothetical protein